MWTLVFALIVMVFFSKAQLEYEAILRKDLGGLFVGRVLGRNIELSIARYRPGRCYVLARAW
jgi:hypothetical protein